VTGIPKKAFLLFHILAVDLDTAQKIKETKAKISWGSLFFF
jgi:hypothetical protein